MISVFPGITSLIYSQGRRQSGEVNRRSRIRHAVESLRLLLIGARSHSACVAAVRIVTPAYVEEDRWPPQIRRLLRIPLPPPRPGV